MKRRFIPDSILGWMLLILVAGILASQSVTVLLHTLNRNELLLRLEEEHAAQRIAAIATFLEHTSPVLRGGVAAAMSDPSLDVRISDQAIIPANQKSPEYASLISTIATNLKNMHWREIRINARQATEINRDKERALTRVSIRLLDNSWINFDFFLATSLSWLSPQLIGLTIASVIAVFGLCLYALFHLTRPLARLTNATEELGRLAKREPIPETGVGEVRRAAKAFNDMQARITRLVEDRLQMIAAISHDLRTPITRLRLRAELMDDAEAREKLLADLDEMEAMIASTLAFAREEGNSEPVQNIDLRTLIKEASEHQPDIRFNIAGVGPWHIKAQPLALKRAIANLIDNAIKYGNEAHVSLSREQNSNGHVHYNIQIDDLGPGIPLGEMEQVFRPFYRIESSRNRMSGGTGLGLSICRSVILSHGGNITLHNRQTNDGQNTGLSVRVILPA